MLRTKAFVSELEFPFCHHGSQPTHQEATLNHVQGPATHGKLSPGSASGLASRAVPPAHQTPGPARARSPEGHRPPLPSPPPCFGHPALPVPSLKLGFWSLPLAWTPQLPGSRGKRSCPGHQRSRAASGRLGCEKAWAVRSKREGAGDPRNGVQASYSPRTHRRKRKLGTGVSPLPRSPPCHV